MSVSAQPSDAEAGPPKDELTGLYNRRFYSIQFPAYCEWATQSRSAFSLAVFEIDQLRSINESLGYDDGNALLCQVSAILQDPQRAGGLPPDYCFPVRYSGDKFCLLLAGVPKVHASSFLEKLCETIRTTGFQLSGTVSAITLKAGLASFPEDTSDPTLLFDLADTAMQGRKGGDGISTPADLLRTALNRESLHLLFPAAEMVGQERLMQKARQLLGPFALNAKPVMVVHGCLGSGKSRFVEEVFKLAQPPLCLPVLCRCLPRVAHQPFEVLIQALNYATMHTPHLREQMVSRLNVIQKNVLSRLMPEWSRISILDSPGTPNPLTDPLAILEDVFLTMLMAPTEPPLSHILVLLFDDAQWLDPQTLSVLAKLKGRPAGADLMVLLSVRSHDETAEANQPLQAFFHDMYDRGGIEFHGLEALTLDEVTRLVRSVIPGLVLPQQAVEIIHAKAAGLPALLQEIVKFLVHRGFVSFTDQGLSIRSITEADIPSNVSDLLFVGIQNVESEIVSVLSKAAVLGTQFDRESLLHLRGGLSDGYLRGVLQAAVKQGLLQEVAPGNYRFCSARAHASFYDYLSESDRIVVHSDVAAYLETNYDVGPSTLRQLALHWQAAGNTERAEAILLALSTNAAAAPAPTPSPVGSGESSLPPEMLPAALRLIQEFRSAVTNFRSFPPGSEVVVQSQRRVLSDIGELLAHTEVLSLVVAQLDVLVNGTRVTQHRGAKKQPGEDLAEALGESGLKGLSFQRGLDLDDVRILMEITSLSSRTLAVMGGWAAVAEARGLGHVQGLEASDDEREVQRGQAVRRMLPGGGATLRKLPDVDWNRGGG